MIVSSVLVDSVKFNFSLHMSSLQHWPVNVSVGTALHINRCVLSVFIQPQCVFSSDLVTYAKHENVVSHILVSGPC